MNINLNLCYAESWHDRYALTWAVPSVAVGLLAALLLGIFTFRESRAYQEVRVRAAEVQRRREALRLEEASLRKELESSQHRELFTKAHFVNTLHPPKASFLGRS